MTKVETYNLNVLKNINQWIYLLPRWSGSWGCRWTFGRGPCHLDPRHIVMQPLAIKNSQKKSTEKPSDSLTVPEQSECQIILTEFSFLTEFFLRRVYYTTLLNASLRNFYYS